MKTELRESAMPAPARPGLSDVIAGTRRVKSPIPRSCHLRQIKSQEIGFGDKRVF
jgi:hypothetical protein